MASVCQGLSSFAPGGGKMRAPGNEVDLRVKKTGFVRTGVFSLKGSTARANVVPLKERNSTLDTDTLVCQAQLNEKNSLKLNGSCLCFFLLSFNAKQNFKFVLEMAPLRV